MTRSIARSLLGLTVVLVLAAALGLVAPVSSPLGRGLVPAAEAASYPKPGQRSTAVRTLQRKLVEAGLLRAQYRTGYYGSKTKKAVASLQRKAGLRRTGKMTKATAKALTKAVKALRGPRTWSQRVRIGSSQSGRGIYAYRAGQPGRPVVVVTATMHGEEDFGQYVTRGLLQGRPIRGIDLWVLPVLNPDGLALDRRWVDGGVDLNRNFPHRWIKRANSGPRAVSEAETRVIMTFLARTQPRYLVSWHQPLFGVDSYGVKDRALMQRLSAKLKIPVRNLDCNGSCHGTMTGWYNENFGGAAITVEYGSKARSTKRMLTTDANAVLAAVGGRRA